MIGRNKALGYEDLLVAIFLMVEPKQQLYSKVYLKNKTIQKSKDKLTEQTRSVNRLSTT